MDLFRLILILSLVRNKYSLVFIDESSRFTKIMFLRKKVMHLKEHRGVDGAKWVAAQSLMYF